MPCQQVSAVTVHQHVHAESQAFVPLPGLATDFAPFFEARAWTASFSTAYMAKKKQN